ncbi:hypothetical protein N836_00680 [Leptolyngbya sp. Heron Island J]|uniref:hypothetical protein n=1 Tax=Leptolyngbya sp. Heron Island J TaxID=1385935 RepID=UPI0003B99FF5|nr:hypothetical protein [Leptolyngbya sp. Heron Island J]ESA36422.1 hypothetical protein N836_00680 [Leptolyngbya sp. Heron Island J]
MDTPDEIALLVMEKDDIHSDHKIQFIRNLMMCARMTAEGVFKCESEISFYESRKRFNQQLIASDNQTLLVLYGITLSSQVLFETSIPSQNNPEEIEDYKTIVDEYSHYLKVLSLSNLKGVRDA